MLTAAVVGVVTLAFGGWTAALVVFAFFIPAVLLSRVGRARKRALIDVGKHGARDAWQVLANGGIATACIALWPHGDVYACAFAGAYAAASADTWGTELGTLAKGLPRSILTLRPLATGLSGGVTLAGTLAEIGGACAVALVAALVDIGSFLPIAIGGIAGALMDSLLGASVQALRWCPNCARACETNPHVCGSATTLRRGLRWIGNDAINLCATITGAVVAGLLATSIPSP